MSVQPTDVLHPGATHSPGRYAGADTRTAALLRYAGLRPTDIPRTADGGPAEVTEAEAVAELRRRGLDPAGLPEPLPPLPRDEARALVRTMLGMGAFLMPVHPGRKTPVGAQWQHQPAVGEDELVAWLAGGGNLGINPARSGHNGWIVIDAEDAAATRFFTGLRLVPTARTAKSQHPLWPQKAGGAHFWVPLPDGVDTAALQSKLGVQLPGGGVADLLYASNAVAPGSRLDSAPGTRYVLDTPSAALGGAEAVRFLVDATAPPPAAGGGALAAAMVRRARDQRPHDPDADRITQQVDAIGWDDWLSGHEDRVQIIGADGGCGCPVIHWHRAGTARSGILHDGCGYGWGAHIFSATMQSELGCPGHLSRLSLRAHLEGRPHDLAAVASDHGVDLRAPLVGVDPITPALWRRSRHSGVGAPAVPTVAPDIPDTAGDTAEEPEDTGLALFRRLDEITACGFWDRLPILCKIHAAAVTNGVYPWGLLGACLPRIACTIPPHVRLVGSAGKEGGGRSAGTSLSLFSVLVGAPEAGKSETIKIADGLITLPPHAKRATSGTGEGLIKSFAYVRKAAAKDVGGAAEPAMPAPGPADPAGVPAIGPAGAQPGGDASSYELVRITDTVMLTVPEMAEMAAEMGRQGTKLSAVLRSAWMGEDLGSTTGEIERRTYLPAHSYRLGAVLGGQVALDALGLLLDEDKLGTPQRFGFFPVKTVPTVGEPVRAIELPPVDWHDGQAAAAQAAGLTGAVAPVWIRRPPAAHRAIEDHRRAGEARAHLPFSVAEARRRADDDDEDRAGAMHGHAQLHQLKLAAVLAVGDGLREPTDEHWEAAGQIMAVRELMVTTVAAVLDVHRENADRRAGRSRGVAQAAAKLAEAGEMSKALQEMRDLVMRHVAAAANPNSDPQLRDEVAAHRTSVTRNNRKGLVWAGNECVDRAYLRLWVNDKKRPLLDEALAQLSREGRITVSGRDDRLIRRAPVALRVVPPAPPDPTA